ncbi:ABC transporter permease subunit [Clostridium sp. BL8]|uniref:ABC transporter permease subunit n=1 Tax=Clostridium sp. BL8 TaxID=1354301 RepID=UPI0009E5D253|nr:ABC transporter permease subunit [Clostridium sp. BL8]
MKKILNIMNREKMIFQLTIKNDEAKKQQYLMHIDENIAELKDQISKVKAQIGKDMDWKKELDDRIKDLETNLKNDVNASMQSKSMLTQSLSEAKYLKDNNIKPMDDFEFNAFLFLERLIIILGQVFLAIGIAVFAADMVSGECTPPTLKLLLTQPVSRGKVIFSKFISVALAAAGLILSIEVIFFLIVGLIYGFGNPAYPVMVGAKYQFDLATFLPNGGHELAMVAGSSSIIPLWKYTVELLLTQGLYIIACTAFIFLVSTLFKSSMVSMGVGTVFIILMTILFNLVGFLKKFAIYVLPCYTDTTAILKGQTATMFNNPNSTFGTSMLVFLGWTVVCYLISHFVFTKKDILI